jgi:FdhD protein
MILDITKETGILRVEDGVPVEKTDPIAVEHTLRISVNGRQCTQLIATPQCLEELALGYLYSAGMIRSLADIEDMVTDTGFQAINVKTNCTEVSLAPLPDGMVVPLSDILFQIEKFLHESEVFVATGAVHSCALLVDNQLLHFMEDIGRHNAFDKAIGAALRSETPLDRAAVLTSGRLPSDMTRKIVHSRVPVAVSRSAPTDAAVELAQRYNLTLCGFARGNRINIYSCRQRIQVNG